MSMFGNDSRLRSPLATLLTVSILTACSVPVPEDPSQNDTPQTSTDTTQSALEAAAPVTFLYPDGTRRTVDASCSAFANKSKVAPYVADGRATSLVADLFEAKTFSVTRGTEKLTATRTRQTIEVDGDRGLVSAFRWNDDFTLGIFQTTRGPVMVAMPQTLSLAARRDALGYAFYQLLSDPSLEYSNEPPETSALTGAEVVLIGILVVGTLVLACMSYCAYAGSQCSATCGGAMEFSCNIGGSVSATDGAIGCNARCNCIPGGGGGASGGGGAGTTTGTTCAAF